MNYDWASLRAAATVAAGRAYAPYSGLRVGAAGQDGEGTVVTGCNVENASYGLTLCAECGLVSAQHAAGLGPLVAVSVVAGDGAPLVPCGRCRQLLLEAGGPLLLLDADGGPVRLGDLLPGAFTGDDLAARSEAGTAGGLGGSSPRASTAGGLGGSSPRAFTAADRGGRTTRTRQVSRHRVRR
jgi:cytidine deaminase